MPSGEDVKALAWEAAQGLLEENHFITLEDTETICRYEESEGIYKSDGASYIKNVVQENFEVKEAVSTHLINEVIGHVQRSTLESRDIFTESNPHLVLENCLFNVDTFQVEPFTPDYHALGKMSVKYDPSIDYRNSLFWRFINEILSSEDVIGVQEELGAILRKDYLTKKFSIYEGETDTGKSTLLNVIQALLGENSISNLSLQQIASKERFYLSRLFGKMANIRDDMPKDIIKTAGALKEVTGRSRITGEFKFQNPFEFVNHAYIIVSCNQLPPFEDDDLAIFNRIKLRQFKNRYGGHATPDRDLERKLTTPEELSAVLNFALEGLKRLRDQGYNFSHEENETKTRDYYKRRSDPLWGFVEDRLDTSDSEAFIPKEELYNAFKEYCQTNSLPDVGKDSFYKHLGDKVTVRSERKTVEGRGRPHCFVGVKLILNGESLGQGGQSRLDDSKSVQGVQGSSYLSRTCAVCGKDSASLHLIEGKEIYLHSECESKYAGKL